VGEKLNDRCTIKTVKHSGDNIMIWGCIGYDSVGNLVRVNGNMDYSQYITILQKNLFDSAEKLGLKDSFIFQQDNDFKHKNRLTTSFFAENKIEVL
jgi:hypothetical protein